MEFGEDTLYLQLHKLSGATSDEALDQLLSATWQSRRTGLHDKPHFQSLLNLPSLSDLDPVLACLRSLIRKCAYGDGLARDDIQKLFPADLPDDLRRNLLFLFGKYQSLWKEDVSKEQRPMPRTNLSYDVRKGTSSDLTSLLFSNKSMGLDDPIAQLDQNGVGSSVPVISKNDVSQLVPVAPQNDRFCLENVGSLPRLKSMTWTVENSSSEKSKRVAVITLKLQDYENSPSGEMEVKFQLTRDTLEAMLRSMTYISDQLSGSASSEPVQKKQKQSDSPK